MTNENTTPRLPWTADKGPKCGFNIRDADGNVPAIARTYNDTGENAAMIVRAVNAHDGLVEALEDLTRLVARMPESHIHGDKLDAARAILETLDSEGGNG